MLLVSDIFGCEALLDTLDQTRDERLGRDVGGAGRTDSAILGPFYRHGVAPQPNGTSIIRVEEPGASYTHLYGTVFDADGKPLHGATIDIWHDAPDGRYDCQAPDKPENHCRGRFVTNANGKYSAIIIKPIAYPIASDNAAGDLLRLLDRHPMRPAHIHYWVEAPGHRRLVTQIFSTDSEYLKDDAVFAVKDKLVVEYKPISKDFIPPPELEGKMVYELEQDIRLQRA
jgi:catechol 1,2-dioxygenase